MNTSRICKYIKKNAGWAFAVTSAVFIFIPEDVFNRRIIQMSLLASLPVFQSQDSSKITEIVYMTKSINIITNRLLVFVLILALCAIVNLLYSKLKHKACIKGKNYQIIILYDDLFKMKDCQKVINFDECFTTEIGIESGKIKPGSICGQYLKMNPITALEMKRLLEEASIKPLKRKSEYKNQDRYEPGEMVLQGDYLLMAFAKLDKNGLGRITRDEYITCLWKIWKEIDKNYAEKDVCIPILGSGITRVGDRELTQQQLLDIMIESYKLSGDKLNSAHRLFIVCKRCEDFSLSKIGEAL